LFGSGLGAPEDSARRTHEGSKADAELPALLTANLVHRPASRNMIMSLAAVLLVLLVVIPGYLVLRDGANSPAFASMDQLNVPTWAAGSPHDAVVGSRWCIGECQVAERDALSTHTVAQTQAEYASELKSAGWAAAPASECTANAGGSYTCWVLDARELDLWVRPSTCMSPAPPTSETGIPEPTDSAPPKASASCPQTSVQIKVFDQIERTSVRRDASG
jgi:hypothetical protein